MISLSPDGKKALGLDPELRETRLLDVASGTVEWRSPRRLIRAQFARANELVAMVFAEGLEIWTFADLTSESARAT
jgi:hypothetical protein